MRRHVASVVRHSRGSNSEATFVGSAGDAFRDPQSTRFGANGPLNGNTTLKCGIFFVLPVKSSCCEVKFQFSYNLKAFLTS